MALTPDTTTHETITRNGRPWRVLEADLAGLKIHIDLHTLLFVVLFVLAIALRFVQLDYKTYHHDESLYSRYCWLLYTGDGYTYDPMQHGPFMFHYTALFYALFGDTEAVSRATQAVMGVLVLLMCWWLRHQREWGPRSAVLAVALLGFTPINLYFNRSFIHDSIFVFFSFGIPVGYVMYLHFRRNMWLYFSTACFAGLFITKANAFVSVLILMIFGTGFVITEGIRRQGGGFQLPRFLKHAGEVLDEHPFMTMWFLTVSLWGVLFTIFAVMHIKMPGILSTQEPQSVTLNGKYFFGGMNVLFLVLTGLCGYATWLYRSGRKHRHERFLLIPASFWRDGMTFFLSFLFFGAICTLFYTSFFHVGYSRAMQSFWDGMGKWFVYWWHQHHIARISGPFKYYLPHFLIYEPLTFFVLLYGVFYQLGRRLSFLFSFVGYIAASALAFMAYKNLATTNTLRAFVDEHLLKLDRDLFLFDDLLILTGVALFGLWLVVDCVYRNMPFRGFLYTWSVLSFCAYSYLQEKVPWLGIHMIVPFHLNAAMILRDFWELRMNRYGKAMVTLVLVVLGAVSFRAAIVLALFNPDNAEEQMVYVQTHKDVKAMVEEIERIATFTGMGRNMPIGVNSDASWPLMWYLRYYKKVNWSSSAPERPVIISNWERRAEIEDMMTDYVGRRYQLRSWFIPNTSEFLNLGALMSQDWKDFWGYVFFKERYRPHPKKELERYGSVDIIMWVHRDLYHVSTWKTMTSADKPNWDNSQNWRMPKDMAARPRPATANVKRLNPTPTQVIGFAGKGDGQLQRPRGLAVDAEGNIWVADTDNHRLQKFNRDGQHLLTVGGNGEGDAPDKFKSPTGLAFNAAGELLVCDSWNHRIKIYDPANGQLKRSFGEPGMFWAPKGIVEDPSSGNMYVVVTGYHMVRVFSPAGKELFKFGERSETGSKGLFNEPVGVAIDQTGRVLVADTANHRVQAFTREGRFLAEYPVDGWEEFYGEPYLAVDARGNILFTDSSKSRLGMLSPTGEILAFIGKGGEARGQFKGARGIALGPDGKVYVADTDNHRIQVFDPIIP